MWSHELLLTGRRDINSYVTLSVAFASDHSQNLTTHDDSPLRWFVHPFPSWMGTGRNASLNSGFFTKIQKYQRSIVLYFHSPLTHKLTHCTLTHTLSLCMLFSFCKRQHHAWSSLFKGFSERHWIQQEHLPLTLTNHPKIPSSFSKSHPLWGLKDQSSQAVQKLPACIKALADSERAASSGNPTTRRTWTLLAGASPEMTTKMLRIMKQLCYEDWLRELGLCNL